MGRLDRMIDAEVAKARKLREQGLSYQKIGRMLGVAHSTLYYVLNESVRRQTAKYYQKHKAEKARYNVKHYQENKEKRTKQVAKYQQEHPEKYRQHSAKRRVLKAEANNDLTDAQLKEIDEIYRKATEDLKVRCYLCDQLIPKGQRHVDHIIPLSKSGEHAPSNLAVACDTCNMSKHDKLPNEVGVLI